MMDHQFRVHLQLPAKPTTRGRRALPPSVIETSKRQRSLGVFGLELSVLAQTVKDYTPGVTRRGGLVRPIQ